MRVATARRMAKGKKRASRSGRQQPTGIEGTGASPLSGNVEGGNVPGGNVPERNVPGGNVPVDNASPELASGERVGEPVEAATELAEPGLREPADATPGEPPAAGNTRADPPDAERIAARAYELYRARGGGEGRALDDWLEAERELAGGRRRGEPDRS